MTSACLKSINTAYILCVYNITFIIYIHINIYDRYIQWYMHIYYIIAAWPAVDERHQLFVTVVPSNVIIIIVDVNNIAHDCYWLLVQLLLASMQLQHLLPRLTHTPYNFLFNFFSFHLLVYSIHYHYSTMAKPRWALSTEH